MGHQSFVVVSPQPRSIYQFADVLNNGVVTFNSPDQCPESNKSMDFLQHHQDPPRRTIKLYRRIKNVVQKSITNEILKSETQFNCPIPITINVRLHGTKCPSHKRLLTFAQDQRQFYKPQILPTKIVRNNLTQRIQSTN